MKMICLNDLNTKEPMLFNIEQITSIKKRDDESIWVYLSEDACATLNYKFATANKFADVFRLLLNAGHIVLNV